MIMTTERLFVIAGFAVAVFVGGCAAPEPQQPPPPPEPTPAVVEPAPPPAPVAPPPPAVKSQAEAALKEAIALYDSGRYDGAIRKLRDSPSIWAAETPDPIKIEARKYAAFSYCVSGRRGSCRAEFSELLRLDPSFELSPAEAGHPLWGPVFEQAKKAARPDAGRRSSKTAPASR